LLCALAFGACVALSPRARADDDATATAAARERFREGVAYFDQKQYEKARAAFVQAYALKKHPAVLLNLAQSELRSNHERDAAKHFSAYLREAEDASPAEREAAQAGLAAAKAEVGEIEISGETGGEVLLNGESEGTLPLPGSLYVDPGTHTIELRKGDRSVTQSVTVNAGESKEANLALAAEAPPKDESRAPASEEGPSDDEDDESPSSRGTGEREPFLHWVTTSPAGVIPAGATVLFGLGAGGFAIASNLSYRDADDVGQQIEDNARQDMAQTRGVCTDPRAVLMQANYPSDVNARAAQYQAACAEHADSTERGDSFKTFAIVSGIGAGVLAVTTIVLYITTAPEERVSASSPSSLELALVPSFGARAGALSLVGRF
jgi:tetratricopeptide (TPR) repeat protein